MKRRDDWFSKRSNSKGEDDMKVPIDDPKAATSPEGDPAEQQDATTEAPEAEAEVEFDEEAMVEAALRAGDAAADEDLAAETNKIRAERDELYHRLEEAVDKVDAAKSEAKDAVERLARLQADWENFRRRTRAERETERERAAEKLVLGLLPVLDDMERAVDHARQTAGDNEQLTQFVDGVNQIHDKMVGVLEKEGVAVIDPAGEPFEPLSHQAVGREENTEAYDETVAQVYQRGYRMGGKVIRPAMVTVTFGGPKRPAPEAEDEQAETDKQD
ncbi:MAG: nucleotide exchange factor GrpE [Coriobacteriales bacterium]|nr:nucleotide exchange factor GrpE [Coriobacteriales bacterium]